MQQLALVQPRRSSPKSSTRALSFSFTLPGFLFYSPVYTVQSTVILQTDAFEAEMRISEMGLFLDERSRLISTRCEERDSERERWLPGLLPTLEKIRIISARTDHEEEFPDNYGEWKIQAFLKVPTSFYRGTHL